MALTVPRVPKCLRPTLRLHLFLGMGEDEEDPFEPLVLEDKPISDSISDDKPNEESETILAELEMVGLLPVEFWGTEGQPKELEGDFSVEEAEWASLTKAGNQVIEGMLFEKPMADIVKHLKPLYTSKPI